MTTPDIFFILLGFVGLTEYLTQIRNKNQLKQVCPPNYLLLLFFPINYLFRKGRFINKFAEKLL